MKRIVQIAAMLLIGFCSFDYPRGAYFLQDCEQGEIVGEPVPSCLRFIDI